MTATLTDLLPKRGAAYDKSKPETRQAWLDQRRGGITATEIRDWGVPSKRRAIIMAKVTGETEDLSHIPAVRHGNLREPMIAAWVEERFGITECNHVYAHAENPRHLASPDGVSLDPFTGGLLAGSVDADLCEIKTSAHDLTPGVLDEGRTLVRLFPDGSFQRKGYYTQMQWQMYVMNAVRTLFVWERHTGQIDPETGTYAPDGPPEWCWIPRDQGLIDRLVEEVAPSALAEIDAALVANALGALPPVSDLPSEDAVLVAEYLRALDAEKIAAAAKAKAWKALQDIYLDPERPDDSIDAGFARLTVSTTESVERRVDTARMREKAPALVAKYEALVARHTVESPVRRRRLTITAAKNAAE